MGHQRGKAWREAERVVVKAAGERRMGDDRRITKQETEDKRRMRGGSGKREGSPSRRPRIRGGSGTRGGLLNRRLRTRGGSLSRRPRMRGGSGTRGGSPSRWLRT